MENDGDPDLHSIFFLIKLCPNTAAIQRARVSLQVIEVEFRKIREGNRIRRLASAALPRRRESVRLKGSWSEQRGIGVVCRLN